MNNSLYDLYFPQPEASKLQIPIVDWDDIVGQATAKAAMREVVDGMSKHADIYKRYKRRPTTGVLLYGPPGNGKTMLAKAMFTAVCRAFNKPNTSHTGFISVQGPELLASQLGQTEANIRSLFAKAKSHKEVHKYPAVIFIDEAEALLQTRSSKGWVASGVGSITVPTFLAEMDGFVSNNAIVILATNRPENIDPAVLREGRIDRKIRVGRPDEEDAICLIDRRLRGVPTQNSKSLARLAVQELFSREHVLFRVNTKSGSKKIVTLGDCTSAAQLTYLVNAATTIAINREIAGEVATGVSFNDFVDATKQILSEVRNMKTIEPVIDYIEANNISEVTAVEPALSDGTFAKKSVIHKLPDNVTAINSVGVA